MIDNRAKIEKQIFLGRQAVRRSQRPSSKSTRHATDETLEQSASTRLLSISTPPPLTGSDLPMPADPDAEKVFANGAHWFYQRGNTKPSHQQEAHDQDPLRSPAIRRKWTSELLHQPFNDEGQAIADPPPPIPASPSSRPHTLRPPSTGFLHRLKTQSFPNLSSPFSSSFKKSESSMETSGDDVAWSSDSSSGDDLDALRHLRHPSVSVSDVDPYMEGENSEGDDEDDENEDEY